MKTLSFITILTFGIGIVQAEILCTTDGVYPVPGDCSRYVRCTDGKAVVLPCPAGLLYNSESGVCDYAANVVCDGNMEVVERHLDEERPPSRSTRPWVSNNVVPQEAECTNGALASNPRDCSIYYVCVAGKQIRYDCPPGSFFSTRLNVCTTDQQGCFEETDAALLSRYSSTSHIRYRGSTSRSPTSRITRRKSLMEDIMDNLADIKSECRRWVVSMMRQEAQIAARTGTSESRKPFRRVQGFMGATPFVKQISFSGMMQSRVLQILKDRFDLSKSQLKNVMQAVGRVLRFDVTSLAPIIKSSPEPTECPFPPHSRAECDQSQRYRTIDGSCNNLNNPLWGRSFRPLLRFLEPDYADGIEAPRVSSQGSALPGARLVSLTLFKDKERPDPVHTVLLMTWGQFLDHDLSRTAMSKLNTRADGRGTLVDVECGQSGCETEGLENRHCLPIPVPTNDPDFQNKQCLMFVRSEATPSDGCKIGPREQLNQLTSYLDASMVYGSTEEESQNLRDKSQPDRGRLRVERNPDGYRSLLPFADNKNCRGITQRVRCFAAGEGRVNEQVALMAIHTIYHRYHNVIEERLHRINPHWSGDRLYQETRRIIGALWQQQVFNEYLPIVLGPKIMQRYGLTLSSSGYWNGYDSSVNPEVTNVFATAAFRFAHSSIPKDVKVVNRRDETESVTPLSSVLNRPKLIYENTRSGDSPIDGILRGQYGRPMQEVEEFFTKQISAKLFSQNPPNAPGTDLISLNIQRGRDHGMPGYTAWRNWCGLSVPRSFQEMADVPEEIRDGLQKLYRRVEDVDLFPAAVCEEHVPGGVVGPTFACILGQQFRNLKVGDRFWFERQDQVTGFSQDQVAEIRKSLIARIVCDTSDDIDSVQPFVLLQPVSKAFRNMGRQSYQSIYSLASLYRGNNNEKIPCSQIPDIDLRKWKE